MGCYFCWMCCCCSLVCWGFVLHATVGVLLDMTDAAATQFHCLIEYIQSWGTSIWRPIFYVRHRCAWSCANAAELRNSPMPGEFAQWLYDSSSVLGVVPRCDGGIMQLCLQRACRLSAGHQTGRATKMYANHKYMFVPANLYSQTDMVH